MFDEFLNSLRANYDGTQIESELGVWRLSVKDDDVLVWDLEDLSKTGHEVLVDDIGYQAGDWPTVFVSCKFDPDRKVMAYRMHAAPPGFVPRGLTSSHIQFSPTGDIGDSAVNYLDLMSSLFQLADDSLKKFAKMWFKQRTVKFSKAGGIDFSVFNKRPDQRPSQKQPQSLEAALEGDDENAIIIAAMRKVLTNKDVMAIFDKGHDMRSNKLINFVRQVRMESAAHSIRRLLT